MNIKKSLFLFSLVLVVLWILLPGARRPEQPDPAQKQARSAPLQTKPSIADGLAAPQRSDGGVSPSGTNAADLYKQAFMLWRKLSDADKKLLRERAKIDPATAPALLEKIKPILALLREAGRADYCDWAMGELSFETPLPQIGLVMDLGRVGAWAATYLFKEDPDAACQVLADHQSLGDSVRNFCLIGSLVQNSMGSVEGWVLRENFASLTPALAEKYKPLFAPSAVEADFPESFQAESALMRKLVNSPEFAKFQKQGQLPISAEQIEQILKQYEQGSKMLQASDAEFSKWNSELQNLAKGTAMETAVPDWGKIRSSFKKRILQRQMLGAALAFTQSAPKQSVVGGQPFIYRQTPGGFELESRVRFDGKPVVLSFPEAK